MFLQLRFANIYIFISYTYTYIHIYKIYIYIYIHINNRFIETLIERINFKLYFNINSTQH